MGVVQQAPAQTAPPPVPSQELPAGSEVLAGGPVHEAFAKPVTLETQTPVAVSSQPPASLQETPPAERPAGAGVVWVPGYWAWDADRNDFVWVCGCWRNPPPNTYWVPGYWQQVGNGWQWISGFWAPVVAQGQQTTIEYLPAPPAPAEAEPTVAAPQPDLVWVPGTWYWARERYVWRRGYWLTQQAGWVWIPSHYVWTPRGYIFCPGHWDYELDNRGVLFSPTYFPPAARIRAGFVFCPSVCVDLGVLRFNLFVYPRYHHYCFGDYYDDMYRGVGIYPWFQCQTVHLWYDPLFFHDSWHHRKTEPHWAQDRAHEFEQRRQHRDLRPPRTFTEVQARTARLPANARSERPLVQPLKTYAASPKSPVKFERVSATDRKQISERATEVHNLREQRTHWEAPAAQPPAGDVKRPAAEQPRTVPTPVTRPPVVKPTTRVPVESVKPDAAQPARTPSVVKPATPPAGEIKRPADVQPRTVPAPVTRPPVVKPTTRVPVESVKPDAAQPTRLPSVVRPATPPAAEIKRPAVTQPSVRVTRPERVIVPTQPKREGLSVSRDASAVKTPPSRPAEEASRVDVGTGRDLPDRDRPSKRLQ